MINCPNCFSLNTTKVYEKMNVPVYQNVVMESEEGALSAPRGNIVLFFCDECTFLFNAEFDCSLPGYGPAYENNQSYSKIFKDHVNSVIKRLSQNIQKKKPCLLEIGCGDGYFLKILKEKLPNYKVCGYDKSLKNEQKNKDFILFNKFYDDEEKGDYDIVISRHVVEHILDNNPLMSVLKSKNKDAQFFIETPSLEWIVEQHTFFDIFYEHCSYFSVYSLQTMFKKHGMEVKNFYKLFSNQYLFIEACVKELSESAYQKELTLSKINNFFSSFDQLILTFRNTFSKNKSEKVAVWGAGAKGVMFLNILDPKKLYVNCVVDINPNKQGKYIPCTGHPIYSPEIIDESYDSVYIMNSNYEEEIKNLLAKNIKVICIDKLTRK